MPAPKLQGTKPVSQGIAHNRKFHFFMVYQNYNNSKTTDKREFFTNKEDAEKYFNSLNQ